jgi:hypothetical protein
MAFLQQKMMEQLAVAAQDQGFPCYGNGQQARAMLGISDRRRPEALMSWNTDGGEVGQQGGGEVRQIGHGAGIYRMALKPCSKTTDVMVLAAMAGIARLSGTRTLPGLSPRLRSRALYRSIRRHTICTRCLTTASRWGRLLWPLLAGRMRLYRMGLSLLCGCSRWLLTSRNTVSEARWMATSGSSPSSRSSEWRPFRITMNQTDLGGLEVVGGSPQRTVRGDGSRPPSAAGAVAESGATVTPIPWRGSFPVRSTSLPIIWAELLTAS